MKKFFATAAALSLTASASFANPNYPVEIVKDGIIYNCEASVQIVDGANTRNCINVGGTSEAGGGLFAGGLAGTGVVAGLAAIIFVTIVATNDDDDTSISTN